MCVVFIKQVKISQEAKLDVDQEHWVSLYRFRHCMIVDKLFFN